MKAKSAVKLKRIAEGECTRCTQLATPGKKLCAPCVLSSNKRSSRLRVSRVAKGLCTRCGRVPSVSGRTVCAGCAIINNNKIAAKTRARVDAGYCGTCGEMPLIPGTKWCEDCSSRIQRKTARKSKERADAGYCIQCPDELKIHSLVNNSRCAFHYVRQVASSANSRIKNKLHPVTRGTLEKLFKQNPRCAYTGIPLLLGDPGERGSTLDHKIPMSKGGTNELSNLQWVCNSVNRLKTDITHEEFVATYGHNFNRWFPEQLVDIPPGPVV